MTTGRRLFRLPATLRRVDRDVDDELRFHIDSRIADLISNGMSPDVARRAAEREYGDIAASRAELAEVDRRMVARHRRVELFDVLRQDFAYALRGLRARPGFAAAVILTLALGIGANAAIFSVVDRLLFRQPALLREPGRTHRVYLAFPSPEVNGEFFFLDDVPYVRYVDLVNGTRSFERTAGYANHKLAVREGQDIREMQVGAVSASFFGFFDAPPALGRYFSAREDAPPSGMPVVVLSYGMWQTRYGGRRDAVGATMQIGPTVYTVIGVAPQEFVGLWPEQPPVAFIPISAYAGGADDRKRGETWWTSYNRGWGTMLVQRRSGVTIAAVNADLTAALRVSWKTEGEPGPVKFTPHALAESILTERGPNHGSVSEVAALVGGMALIVLLIACANVANLLLARALRRRREIAVRLALGVSRRRLLSQLLTESVLLALLGGVAGLVAAQWGGAALRAAFLPPGAESPVMSDTRTLVFVGVAVLLAGVFTGLAPAWQAGRVDITLHLKSGARDGTMHRSRAHVTLLVMQSALSVLLLVGAGLFVRSLDNVKHLPLGYDVAPVLTVNLNMRDVKLDSARAVALRDRLLEAAQRIPGVEHAALNLRLPLANAGLGNLVIPGIDSMTRHRLPNFYMNAVTPDYFATMGTRIVRGRGIVPGDVAGVPGAVVVSRAMAKLLWPGKDALGQCVKEADDMACRYVIGIAEDIKSNLLSDDPGYHYYLSAAQFTPQKTGLVMRMRGDASHQAESIRRVLQKEMPGVSYITVTPFADVLGEQMQSWQLGATMFVVFGVLALVLAAIGLYGVIAYNVTQRSHEMGVRIALGAGQADVVWLVVRQGVLLGGLGIVIGGAVTLAVAGRLTPLLFDESPRDPLVYALVATAMLAVAGAASFIPARRAALVDPNVALRSE